VFRLPSIPLVFLPSRRMAFAPSPKLFFGLRKLKLDVVHTQTEFPLGIFGRVVADLFHLPTVHTYHTMYEDYVHYIANGHLITPRMAQQFSRIFCNRAKVVITPAEKTRNSLIAYGVRRPIMTIPTGIDFSPFSRSKYSADDILAVKRELGIAADAPVVVFVGRVAIEKSLDVVLKAMPALLKNLPDAKLAIVGDGPAIPIMQALADGLGITSSVVFAGGKRWETIGKYYQLGDVFVTASTSETQGLTYIEAIAAKTPVIAKKDQSIDGVVIHGETGLVFENNEDLPGLMYEALTHKEEMTDLTERAFENIQRLSAEQFAKNLEAVYAEVIEDNKVRPHKPPFSLMKAYNLFLKNLNDRLEK
jgi:1,2-diacylglycerol 3-alpha-glucosyltransferase